MSLNIKSRNIATGLIAILALAAPAMTVPMASARAEEFRHEEFRHHEFHEREVGRFGHHDLDVWRGGVWRHEWRNGRLGWWWFTGGVWYLYDQPVYPYPPTVSGLAFIEPPGTVVVDPNPPAVVVQHEAGKAREGK